MDLADKRGDNGNLLPVRAVARAAEVPGCVLGQGLDAACLQVLFNQRQRVAQARFSRRVVHEGDAQAVGPHVVAGAAFVRAWQFVRRAGQQVGDAPACHVQQQQVQNAAHRHVVVPIAVEGFAGGVAGFFAILPGLVLAVLRGSGLQTRPDPGREDDALAVGQPLEGLDAGAELADAHGLAAVGRNEVKLRRVILLAALLALGDECDALTLWRPRGLPVFGAAACELARRPACGGQQPEVVETLVLLGVRLHDGAHRALTVGCQRDGPDAFNLPEDLRRQQGRGSGRCHAR